MKTRLIAWAVLLAPAATFASAGHAQDLVTTPAVAPVQPAPAQPVAIPALPANLAVLRTGTEVPLKLLEELTTKNKQARVGQRFRMEVAETVFVNGVPVLPVGSPAVGEITDVRNKGMWGKSGHLGARILYLTVNGRQVRLSGAFDDKGKAGGVGAVAVSSLVFLPAGFFMTGTSARIPMGATVKGFVDEDVQLAFAATPAAPMTVPVTPQTVTVPVAPAQPLAQPAVLQTVADRK